MLLPAALTHWQSAVRESQHRADHDTLDDPPEPARNDDEVRLGFVKMTVSSRPSADDDGCHITITIDNQGCGDRLFDLYVGV